MATSNIHGSRKRNHVSSQQSIASFFAPSAAKAQKSTLPSPQPHTSPADLATRDLARDSVLSSSSSSPPVVVSVSSAPVSSVVSVSCASAPPPPSSSAVSVVASASSASHTVTWDVGLYMGNHSESEANTLDEYTKFQLLNNQWAPPPLYEFPYSTHGQKKRYMSAKYLALHKEWLVYSPCKKGVYCKCCTLFTVSKGAGYNQNSKLESLVTKPLVVFKDLSGDSGDLAKHASSQYHKQAFEMAKNFSASYLNPALEVSNQVDSYRLQRVRENRTWMTSVVQTVILCGRNNLPLRGHRDDGALDLDKPGTEEGLGLSHEGVFRQLLRYRAEGGDEPLKKHFMESSGTREVYSSKTIQNEIIRCCGLEIQDEIIERVRGAKWYSVMFDETTDESHASQISVVLRYLHKGSVREDFIAFINAFPELDAMKDEEAYNSDEDDWEQARKDGVADKASGTETGKELSMTGKALGQVVLRALKKRLGLPLEKCVGIGTDGCSVMMSEEKGAVAEIQTEAQNALKSPCFSHKLNNSISKSNKVPVISTAVHIMKDAIHFFVFPKRRHVLMKILGCALSSLSETRWVERHDGVLQFAVDLPKVIQALTEISNWADKTTSSKALSLIENLSSPQFLVSVVSLSDVLSLTAPLSRILQTSGLDLFAGSSQITDTIAILARRREECDLQFSDLWARVEELGRTFDPPVEMLIPRRCSRQLYRANYSTNSPEEFYRLSTYVPLLDHVLADMRDRFPAPSIDMFHLFYLLPNSFLKSGISEDKKVVEVLASRFHGTLEMGKNALSQVLSSELTCWRQRWTRKVQEEHLPLPKSVVEALEDCEVVGLDTLHTLLVILVCLPVSNATTERSFSNLRRLKTWLRATMGQSRLVGLALMNIHQDIPLYVDKVIDRFAKSKKRKVSLIL